MTPNLRPKTLGEILDATFRAYRSNFLVFVGIATLPSLIMFAVYLADHAWLRFSHLLTPAPGVGAFLWGIAVSVVFYHVSILASIPFLPAVVHAASNQFLNGHTSARSSLRLAFTRWGRYCWIGLLKAGVHLLAPEVGGAALLIGLAYMGDKFGIFNGHRYDIAAFAVLLLPVLITVCLFLWLGACLSLVIPAAACEDHRGRGALRRSFQLSRGSRGRIVALWLIAFTLSMILSMGAQLLFRWLLLLLYSLLHLRYSFYRFYFQEAYLLNALLSSLIFPVYPIAITLIYYDQRVRREGFDIEWMMQQAGMTQHPESPQMPLIYESPRIAAD